ncbi:ABC transporter permease [Rhodococcus sp. NPDC056743]|jgi:NitT/TauT family transport system permease protein|uniref:ABC transporter permease n=1 Tax=Rhodococcus sp. NPDC056743 TaxID=3345934 RepID=UPI00366FA908
MSTQLETTVTAVPATRSPAAPVTKSKRSWRPSNFTAGILATQLVIVIGFLVLWEVAVNKGWANALFVSQPSAVWGALIDYVTSKQMRVSAGATLTAVVQSFVIGSVSGIVVGCLIGTNEFLDRVFSPFLVPLNAVPRIALAPLFVAWFGLTNTSKVVMGVSIVFFLLVENSRSAVKGVDRDQMTMAKVVGLNRQKLMTKVILPSAVPTIFAGLRLAITYAILGVIASEMIAAKNGLGQDIVRYSSEFQIDYVFAVLIVLVTIATVASVGSSKLERWLLRWQD